MTDKVINGSLDVIGAISQNGHSIAPQISVTWTELKALRDGGTLVPGQQYRITDYQCTTTQANTSSAGHQFDIIVTADSENVLNENARSCLHDGDTYFANCKLESWELKYCLDNDANRFKWADATNGKGVVYWMRDEHNNECPYDFKNILFKRYKVWADDAVLGGYFDEQYFGTKDTSGAEVPLGCHIYSESDFVWMYTFTGQKGVWNSSGGYIEIPSPGDITSASVLYDLSIIDMNRFYNENAYPFGCSDNVIKECHDMSGWLNVQVLNNIVFIGWFTDVSTLPPEYEDEYGNRILAMMTCLYSNSFDVNCQAMTFSDDFLLNDLGENCQGIAGSACYENTVGKLCRNINMVTLYHTKMGDNCWNSEIQGSSHIIGNGCYTNIIADSENTLGAGCSNNVIHGGYNSLGISCQGNHIGGSGGYNSLGNRCSYITLGSDCSYNSFGNGCNYIVLGTDSKYNRFGNGCNYVVFGSSDSSPINYCDNIVVDDGCQYLKILSSDASATSRNILKNVHVHLGVSGSSSSNRKTLTVPDRNLDYETNFIVTGTNDIII